MIEFLTELFHSGYSYETINTARSAISSLCNINNYSMTLGSHPLVIRFMTGVYNLRPTKSKYVSTWDISQVLCYLKTMYPDENISLKNLSHKLAMLMALICASRCHSLSLLTLENIQKDNDQFIMFYCGLLKQTRKGKVNPIVKFKKYLPDRKICVYSVLEEYIKRTDSLRGTERRLFISYIKPYKAVTSSTISRWLKCSMFNAGIDTEKFKSHSVRSASVSKAKTCDVPISEILKVAGWASDRTFAEFYDKPITAETYETILQ